MSQNVLISGAGIAGVTLAYWLRRHGYTPTVVERAPAIREGGYKIDIRGAALTVVERMELMDEIRARRTDVRSGTVVNSAGKRVASMDGDTFGGRTHGDAEILRGDLHRLLYDLTGDEVEYLFGDHLTALKETSGGVEVALSSGGTRTFDLVVGADGLHSATRSLAFGPEEEYVRDLGHRISIFSVPNHLGLDREEVTYVGPGRTTLMYSTAGDDSAKAMFLFSTAGLGAAPRDADAQKEALASAYADEGWEVPRLLEGIEKPPTSTTTRSARSTWTAGLGAALPSSATRRTAPRPPRGRARAWPWSARTSWRASWPRPAEPTRRRTTRTSGRCAPSPRPTRTSARPTSSGW